MATGHVRDGCIFPVGFIVQLTVDADPAEYFGGKWQRIKGRFLLAADDTYPAGSTGGEAEHTLTLKELPKDVWHSRGGHPGGLDLNFNGGSVYGIRTLNTDLGQPHNNMPPYRSVYVWERIG